MGETNWAGNYAYRAARIHHPASLTELQELVAAAPKVRALGTGHTFSAITDSEELVSLERMPVDLVVDRDAQTVSFGAQLSYGALAQALAPHALGLANLASLPHIAVAGAASTATHGSGDRNGNLATAVTALEMVTSDGRILAAKRGDPDFDGMVVALGALGVVTRITLTVEPTYEVRQDVFEGLAWDTLLEEFDAITSAAYSVSIFTLWDEPHTSVWIKSRTDAASGRPVPPSGTQPASAKVHMIGGQDPVNCTPQLGEPGPWSERLAHFRMGFTPSAGAEIQSEYIVARRHAVPALAALRELADLIQPLLQITEIRTVAADGLWLSPQYEQDTVCIHFTWRREQEAIERVLVDIERALEPFSPRPHWGKLFLADAATIAQRYPRLGDFSALAARLDPRAAFTNDWLAAHVLADASHR
jgi:xylitol oxidase